MSQSQPDSSLPPKPFSAASLKVTLSRIVYFYSLFMVVVKVFSAFQNGNFLAYMLIALPFGVLTFIGFKSEKSKSYSWVFVVVGILLISVMRYYELEIIDFLLANGIG